MKQSKFPWSAEPQYFCLQMDAQEMLHLILQNSTEFQSICQCINFWGHFNQYYWILLSKLVDWWLLCSAKQQETVRLQDIGDIVEGEQFSICNPNQITSLRLLILGEVGVG